MIREFKDAGRARDGNSLMAPDPPQLLRVDHFTHASAIYALDLWDFYREAFTGINELAVQRHLMTRDEFVAMCTDGRISKYAAYDDSPPWADPRLAGLSVMTSDLAAWPLVAPEAFARRYPGRKVFYVGFVGADGSEGAYMQLVLRMYREVIAADGIAVMDFCGHNVDQLQIARKVDVLLRRTNGNARGEMVDRQEFWAWDFRGQP